MSEVVEATIVTETKLAKIELQDLVKENDLPILRMMDSVETLEWHKLKPNQMAVLLMAKPFSVSGGGQLYLSFKQALYFAVRCFELGVSPFSNSVWFDPAKFSVNLTLEGKREVARNRGIDLGPPKFEMLTREWKDVPKITDTGKDAQKAGFTKDIGYKCSVRVGDVKNNEHSEYIAWINDWYVSRSPVWQNKPDHMLQIRASEKAISMALGTGASAMPDEKELE